MSFDLYAAARTTPIPLLPPFYESPHHVDSSYFLGRIEEEFGLCIERYTYLMDAFDHDVFIVNEETVFRFPRSADNQEHLVYEIEFLDRFGSSFEANTPLYMHVSTSGDFAGYELIPRYILSPWEFRKLDKERKSSAIQQLSSFVSTFHRLDAIEFSRYARRQIEDFVAIENRIRKQLAEQLFPKLDKEEVKTIQDFYDSLDDIFRTIPNACPTHGDLYAFNIVWDEITSKVGVIDFSDMIIGDPANDFEAFYDYGSEYAEMAYDLYDGPKDPEFPKRAEAYYRLHAIYTLLSSQLGARITFDHARMRFRQKFSLNSTT